MVLVDAAIANLAVPARDEPGDGSFDHGSVMTVVRLPGRVFRALPMCALQAMMLVKDQGPALGRGGALCPEGTAAASDAENDFPGLGDLAGDTSRAGRGAGRLIDGEVIDVELSGTVGLVAQGFTIGVCLASVIAFNASPVP